MNFQIESFLILGLCLGFISGGNEIVEEKFEVTISERIVEVKCPAKLYKEKNSVTLQHISKNVDVAEGNNTHVLHDYSEAKNGLYNCYDKANPDTKESLYLKAYVCDNCREVSVPVLIGVLIGDCLVTIGVAVVIYVGCKKKSGLPRDGGIANGGRTRGNKERPPPVPSPDYEQLMRGRQEIYHGLEHHIK